MPQGAELSATTLMPRLTFFTPGPTSSTTPASSWPNSAGGTIMRMVAALIHLQIGAARKRHFNLDQHFTNVNPRNRDPLNLYVLFAVQHGGCHFPVQLSSFHLVSCADSPDNRANLGAG